VRQVVLLRLCERHSHACCSTQTQMQGPDRVVGRGMRWEDGRGGGGMGEDRVGWGLRAAATGVAALKRGSN